MPAPVLTAFGGWRPISARSSAYGTLPSLATLAYDCRRPDHFRRAANRCPKKIHRGDLRRLEMRGPWAGDSASFSSSLSVYFKYGVDFDGDGLGST